MRGKRNHLRAQYSAYMFLASFAIATVLTVSTILPGSAHAVGNASVDYNVTVEQAMAVSVSSQQVSLLLNPAAYRPFDSQDLDVSVTTNNKYGYELFMSANSTDLTNTDDSTEKINTLPDNGDTGYTESTFVDNKWGYKVGSGNYFPFVSGDKINSYSEMAINHTTNLNFAAKADMTKPAGTYSNTLVFSAVAKPAPREMQNLDGTYCTSEPTLVSDTRDANLYYIARLADGNCWMLDNLRLDPTTVPLATLQGKTNATNQTLEYFKNGGGSSPYPASGVVAKTANNDTWNDSYNLPYVVTSGTDNGGWDKDTTVTSYGVGSGKTGVYYNYCAVSAGSYCYADGVSSGDARQDICPAGWRMPTGGESGEYQALASNYSDYTASNTTSLQYNFSATLQGAFNGSVGSVGNTGFFWSATYGDTHNMRAFLAMPPAVAQAGGSRAVGFAVRCILNDDLGNISEISSMQELGTLNPSVKVSVLNSMVEEQAYELADTRETGRTYYVSKLKDGNVWMLQNLRLGEDSTSMSLTTADSNTPSAGFTLNGKLSNGNFTYTTIDGKDYQNDSSQYFCPNGSSTCYYNWYTATAGSGTSSSNSVNNSICPVGWGLPTANTTGQFQALYNNYNSAMAMLVSNPTTTFENTNGTAKPGFTLTGHYNSSGIYGLGSYGHYWSRTGYTTGAQYLEITTYSVSTAYGSYKYLGLPIRCMLK